MTPVGLVLGFGVLVVGIVLLTSGTADASFADVLKGKAGSDYDADESNSSSSNSSSSSASSSSATAATGASYSPSTYTGKGLSGGGFEADPGTNFTVNQEPQIAADLEELGEKLHETIVGISGYRTPAQSVAVGGSADDPHTKGIAADIGVNSSLRATAASITEAELASVGLWRPFDPTDNPDNPEVNHVEPLGESN